MCARLPLSKLNDLVTLIRTWVGKKWCTVTELESLLGKLNHACAVVMPGRTFLRRLFNLLRDARRQRKYTRLNNACRLNLNWWHEFLPTWNGVCFFDLPDWAPLPNFELTTDASGNLGFGAYNKGEWFCQTWLTSQQNLGMAYKELYPIVLACHIRRSTWAHTRVQFYCDNQSAVHIIHSSSSKTMLSCYFVSSF